MYKKVLKIVHRSNEIMHPDMFMVNDSASCIGCAGGFPYLIGGKYAEDFGLVLEECNPYKGTDGQCSTITSCPRMYSTKYEYIGGFYGA